MRFPKVFWRSVGVGPYPALGSDVQPVDSSYLTQDNVYKGPLANTTGEPVKRFIVAYAGPPGAIDLSAKVFMREEETDLWFAVGAPILIKASEMNYFDLPILANSVGNASNSIEVAVVVVVDFGVPPDGTYLFALAPDIGGGW